MLHQVLYQVKIAQTKEVSSKAESGKKNINLNPNRICLKSILKRSAWWFNKSTFCGQKLHKGSVVEFLIHLFLLPPPQQTKSHKGKFL